MTCNPMWLAYIIEYINRHLPFSDKQDLTHFDCFNFTALPRALTMPLNTSYMLYNKLHTRWSPDLRKVRRTNDIAAMPEDMSNVPPSAPSS